jgi:tRNA (cmo5U34)-methyltransferase
MENDFSFSTITGFDTHIDRSICGYSDLLQMTVGLPEYFIEDGTNIYDLGCSTGKLLRILDEKYRERDLRFYGLEKEFNFVKDLHNTERISFLPIDLTRGFQFDNACMILSLFTIQFIPPRYRQSVLKSIYKGLNPGGAFIFAEKQFSAHPQIQDIFTFQYYDHKKRCFSSDEIFGKELSLRSLLKPKRESDNLKMLQNAGFNIVEPFWRRWNFVAYICFKD